MVYIALGSCGSYLHGWLGLPCVDLVSRSGFFYADRKMAGK